MALVLPVAALLDTLLALHSAWRHRRGKGGAWKGRHQTAVGSGAA